jgi:hypothetical protein
MTLEGAVINGMVVLDTGTQLPEGARVRVEVETPSGSAAPSPANHFRDLVREWKEATLYTSSITEMATHRAYQQIIGMGKAALPLIFDELRREPDHWFWALKAITGEDPVPPADRGNVERMTEAWLAWAGSHGY